LDNPSSSYGKNNFGVFLCLTVYNVYWLFDGGVYTIQQTSSKRIQNTRANAGRLLDVCWIV